MEIIDKKYLERQFNLFMKAIKDKFVEKQNNKGLSENDFTSHYRKKLDGLKNYDDRKVNSDINAIKNDITKLSYSIDIMNRVIDDLNLTVKGIKQSVENVNEKLKGITSNEKYDDGEIKEHISDIYQEINGMSKMIDECKKRQIKSVQRENDGLIFIFKNDDVIRC